MLSSVGWTTSFGFMVLGKQTSIYLHADNCTGQNKNNAMINYLQWRVLTGRHTNITYFFLVVGQTKFSPDWCFGLFKRLFKGSKVNCMADIAAAVDNFAVCNVSQLVHTEDTEVVPTRDWATFLLTHFWKITNIKQSVPITSGYPPHLQKKCLPGSMLTLPKYHCLFSRMTGTLDQMTFHL